MEETLIDHITENQVGVKLSHHSTEQYAFTDLDIQILVRNQKAGIIDAVLINRRNIPKGYFLSEMDDYSQDTQWLGVVLFDPKHHGKTRLKSMLEPHNPYAPFLYIKTFSVKEKYRRDDNSDVGAFALKKLLEHPFILDEGVSSAIYVVDGVEAMSKIEKEEFDQYQKAKVFDLREKADEETAGRRNWEQHLQVLGRKDANQFLRNGFFQDEAYANVGGSQAKILVASHNNWERKLISHSSAEKIKFCDPPPEVASPKSGIDEELFKFVKKNSPNDDYVEVGGAAQIQARKDKVREDAIIQLVSRGASITRSHVLHCAVANNCYEMTKSLLLLEHDAIDTLDDFGATPLIVAAINAAGRSTKDGIKNTRIIELLLAEGAKRELCDRSGMTAYGNYLKQREDSNLAIHSMMGMPVPSSSAPKHPSEERLMKILLPANGPTNADLRGGNVNPGIVEYDCESSGEDSYGFDDSDGSY
jgi:hypothetical protein